MNSFKEIVEENFSELPEDIKESMSKIAENHAKQVNTELESFSKEEISIIPLTLHLVKRLHKECPEIKIVVDESDHERKLVHADVETFDLHELATIIGEDNASMELQNLVTVQAVRRIVNDLLESKTTSIATQYLVEGVYTIRQERNSEDESVVKPRLGIKLKYSILNK